MDEQAYRQRYKQLNSCPCVFEKAVLSNRCTCKYSQRLLIAEREAGACTLQQAQFDCQALIEVLRENAKFALKLTHIPGSLPHGKEVKVQVGGLLGLQACMDPGQVTATQVIDVQALVRMAKLRYGSLEQLPFSDIVKHILNYQHRKRRK
ncbi:MAG: hypothetical protein GXP09_11250 [Gammaproteobacteria bacterium]|nr:hypothetical protein [Gammaproteobacteria bacterium]